MSKLNLIFYCNVEKDLVYFSWSDTVEQQEEGDQKTQERNNTLHFYLWVSLSAERIVERFILFLKFLPFK